uniref:Uncharacterized protein n=1 Tax=Anguilla anguilla TaxID=7936 RepID=A0A0E9WM80_ANGAN
MLPHQQSSLIKHYSKAAVTAHPVVFSLFLSQKGYFI